MRLGKPEKNQETQEEQIGSDQIIHEEGQNTIDADGSSKRKFQR